MCLDIQLRESSNGQRGILSLMRDLGKEYGSSKPFNDEDLFAKITALTYPAVGEFLKTYVAGSTPIPYETYFAKVGVTKTTIQKPGNPFIKGEQEPYISVNQTKEIFLRNDIETNEFFTALGMKKGDTILAMNDTAYNLDNIYDMITASTEWKGGEDVSFKIKRDGKEQTVKGKVKLPVEEAEGYHATDASKAKLREAWLKG